MGPELLVEAVLAGDRRALARALRIIEDRAEGWESVLAGLWPKAAAAHLVGVTGSPGVGKSTLSNALITAWRARGRLVGVVAVDPASPFTGGALLGDRIRMQEHASDPGVFVRSMSSRGRLGGLAEGAAGVVAVLAAAGFDPVLLETVGVGQSEIDVVYHADTVVVMVTPRWGDGVQLEKAGILEIADVFVVNKADQGAGEETRRALEAMITHARLGAWVPPVIETVATTGSGVDELVESIDRHRRHLASGEGGAERRRRRARMAIASAAASTVGQRLQQPESEEMVDEVAAYRLDPWQAARALIRDGP